MAKHRCEICGRYMRLTDLEPQDDAFDEELAIECGFNPDIDTEFDDRWARFHYVQDQWECENCGVMEWYTEGKKYYFDPDAINWLGAKPITLKEQAEINRQAQEAAGQLRLFEV
jgi:hypothetical protein